MINELTLLIGITLLYATPLILASLGGVLSERAGVINIGIEGMMTVGAFVGAATGYFSASPWVGLLCAALSGAIFSMLHAVASVSFKADQTISGMALNLIGPGLALFFCRVFFEGSTNSQPVPSTLPRIFGNNLNDQNLSNLNVNISFILAILAAIFIWFLLYKTKWGLRIRSVGEHPAAADTLGVSVTGVRYACVIGSGVLAGLAGGSITLNIVSQFGPAVVAGQGFIALAAVIFGKWTPHGAFGACLIFGFAQALVVVLGGGTVPIPSEILTMLPYVLTLIILVLFIRKSSAPKADGVPYEKGAR